MQSKWVVGTALLALFTATGCGSQVVTSNGSGNDADNAGGSSGTGSTGGAMGDGTCHAPTETVALDLDGAPGCDRNSHDPGGHPPPAPVDGVFEPTADGFHIVGTEMTIEARGIVPNIPTGTFVHLSYDCSPGFYSGPGAFVRLENLATLGGEPNPTEQGARLWFFAAAGGEVPISPEALLPFDASFTTSCDFAEGDPENQDRTLVASIELKGASSAVTALPGQETIFSTNSGPHAGRYRLKNVDVTAILYSGGDVGGTMNFTITRAD